ncbi:hypothetical protein [Rugosimonospora africana]|uniref:Uncharacterized protein n=1 Tax=Rugosimonospora africana TaxID=556532 RepID=A0A8J3VQW0_9ACTN|nr:hypothetical protein [Rugosimonospora africana]GIH15519.1 hypothetical protein Raf01_36910 [Rugosimonospora africana]
MNRSTARSLEAPVNVRRGDSSSFWSTSATLELPRETNSSYQPGSRFWPFQWIEGGWLLTLSVLLIAVTVWVVRRRAV